MGPEDYKIYTLPVGDITRAHGLTFHGYADDSDNYVSFKLDDPVSFEKSLRKVSDSTAEIKAWMTQNKLKLNDTKTEVLIIVPPSQCSKYPSMDIKIADATVETATSAKSLGISFDRNMTMETEIVNRCRNLLYHLRNIRTIRQYITQNACEKLVHALISSRLDYANSILVSLPKRKICRLQSIQNIAARIITETRKFDHITSILRSLHWLLVESRIQFKILSLTFRIIHGLAPAYLTDLISIHQPSRCLRSSSRHLLVVPKSRTKMYGDRAFSVVAPKLWNKLPESLQNEQNYKRFKKCLKTHLFKLNYRNRYDWSLL